MIISCNSAIVYMLQKVIGILIIGSSLISCSSRKSLDLSNHGIPIVISVPEGAFVQELDLVVMKEINIRKGDFHLQMFIHNPINGNGDSLLWLQMEAVSGSGSFREFVELEPLGFIYANENKEGQRYYGFRYLIHLDSTVVLARQHPRLESDYSAIKSMYQAISQAKKFEFQ